MGDLPRRPLQRVSTLDALVTALRDSILDGEVGAAMPVTETEVVATYNVSRPTAKAAIRALVDVRILRQEPNKSAVVAKLSAQDVEDLYRLRIPIELEILREIIKRRAAAQPKLQVPPDAARAVQDMRSSVEVQLTAHEFVSIDLRFHRALAQCAGSARLLQFFEGLEGELHLSMLQSYEHLDRQVIALQHAEILEAVEEALRRRDRDWTAAREAMKRHLFTARDRICAALSDQHSAGQQSLGRTG